MRKIFSIYRRFLGTVFVLWLFLWIAGKIGFAFGVDLRLFFRVFFWFFLVYLICETKTRWPVIFPIIKNLFLKARNEFVLKTETTKKEIISSSPKIFTGKTGNSLVFVLAIILSLFSFFRQFFKNLSRFILQPGTLLAFAILGILANIFVFDFTSDLVILILTGFLVLSIRHYKFEGRITVGLALVFLSLCPFLLILGKEPIAEKTANWAYMFLLVGVIQMAWENRKEIFSNESTLSSS